MRRVREFARLWWCVVLLASAFTRQVHAQGGAWSTPRRVSDEAIMSWFPSLAADRAGGVHLAYASADAEDGSPNAFDMIEYVALDGDRPIGSPIDVMATPQESAGSYAGRPDLLIDRDGDVLMTWRNRVGLWFTRAPRAHAVDPPAWRESVPLGEGYFSRLLQDADGALHVIYTSNVRTSDCAVCFHVFHRSSTDGGVTWSTPVDVSVLETGAARPQALFDARGGLHVVWEMARGGDLGQTTRPRRVAYAASFDQGRTWSDPRVLDADEAATPALAIDGAGALLVMWMGQNDGGFYFVRSIDRGHSWSLPSRIEGATNTTPVYDARLDGQTAVVDGRGRVHWFAVGRTLMQQKGLSLLHVMWDGIGWGVPEVVVDVDSASGDVPQWPSAAVVGGNRLYVAWYLRRGELTTSTSAARKPYEVLYAYRLIDAPAQDRVAFPTPTPDIPAAATAPPRLRVDPTIPPVSGEVTEASMQALKSEGELWKAIAFGLTPLLLLAPVAWWLKKRSGSS